MDAKRVWMIGDFIGKTKVLFQIPVYQRNYDWSESNCMRLLYDIDRILETNVKHFLGSIVFMSSEDTSFSLPIYTIIDGQQRLTTMMILLKALADVSKDQERPICDEIQNLLLRNQYCDEEFKIKLKPIQSDNDQFVALLADNYETINHSSHIYRNYIICKKHLDGLLNKGYSARNILLAMRKLEIVYIELKKEDDDDPQVIFESINSTGLDLSNSDLIRNFLLMNAPDQERLFNDYWVAIEKLLKKNSDYSNLNLFFTHFITYKTGISIKSEQIYDKFVKLYKENNYTNESILKELKYYAKIFHAFVDDSTFFSEKILKILSNLRFLKQTTCYPFLLHVFDDFQKCVISEEVLIKTLTLIQTYLIRRAVCGVPTNTLRSLFISLYNRVFKVESNKSKYYETINKFLHTASSKNLMPSDSEFERMLQTTNIYSNIPLCKFLLMEIENGNGREKLNADHMTIEHIMPQHLGVGWRYISDDEHEQYLHVLGNLSVTGYNSELSNRSFEEKKEIIKTYSKATVLNSDVWNQETWTIDCIVQRGKRLASIVAQLFNVEKIEDPSIEFEYLNEITLQNFSNATGAKLVMFRFGNEIYRQNKFAPMLVDMIKLLDRRHPSILESLALARFSLNSNNQRHPYLDTSTERLRVPTEIKKGIFLESNLSSNAIIHFIDALLEQFHEDKNLFSFSVIADENSVEAPEDDEFELYPDEE